MQLPTTIFSGYWKEGHIQGIAVDAQKGFVYFSFTTILLKTDLQGNPVGSVKNLAGHLGCITFDPDRQQIYGALELKHDSIGREIIDRTGWDPSQEDNFYLVSFDCDKIDRMELDAEADGIMRSVWLSEVVKNYQGTDPVSGKAHIYGCSGIDGTGYGPVFGQSADSPKKILVAYGIYSELSRTDNDHQVLLQLDPSVFDTFGQPLNQSQPHHCGPEAVEARYFLFTGNTRWGVQNLEYDPYSRNWLVAVYRGEKPQYPNYPMFLIDGTAPAVEQPLVGRNGEVGKVLKLAKDGLWMKLGATGVCSLGDGSFYFSDNGSDPEKKAFCSTLRLHHYAPETAEGFTPV